MSRLIGLAVAGCVALGGCASGLPGLRPLTYATPGQAMVFATGDKCVHEPADKEFGGLVAAALTGVASTLLKNFGTALTEGAKGGALPSSTATRNLQLDPGKTPKCVVVVRGSFQPGGKAVDPIDLASFLGLPGDAADQRRRLADLRLPPVYRVDHYVELRVGASSNGKALTFAPLFVRVARSIDGAASGERDLSIAVKFNRAGADPVGSAVVVADRRIGVSSEWAPDADGRYAIEAPWFGTFHAPPAPTGGGQGAGAAAGQGAGPAAPAAGPVGGGGAGAGGAIAGPPAGPGGSTTPTMQSRAADAVPVTVTVTVVETRPTNEGLAFVATVFNGLQPKIEAAVKPLIDSDARRATDVAEETGDLGLQVDLATAEGTAQSALIGYCSASSAALDAAGRQDRIAKSIAARNAQLKANVAAIKAGVAQPYGALVSISADPPSTANPGACT